MNSKIEKHVKNLITRFPQLKTVEDTIVLAYKVFEESYINDHKLLIAGNGGSATDSEHIAGELMKRFVIPRPISENLAIELKAIDPLRGEYLSHTLERGLMVVPLVAHEALNTAYINDVGAKGLFAQQLLGYGRTGDVFLGISTSGNSDNIMNAAVVARALKMKIVGLTGADGGELARFSDVAVKVPEDETYKIQELHLPIYHCWCLMLEERFFGEKRDG